MDRPSLQYLSLRMAGVVVTLAVLFVIDLNVDNVINQLWLPLLLAAGAYLMTLSVMAVAIAVGASLILWSCVAKTEPLKTKFFNFFESQQNYVIFFLKTEIFIWKLFFFRNKFFPVFFVFI